MQKVYTKDDGKVSWRGRMGGDRGVGGLARFFVCFRCALGTRGPEQIARCRQSDQACHSEWERFVSSLRLSTAVGSLARILLIAFGIRSATARHGEFAIVMIQGILELAIDCARQSLRGNLFILEI